MTPPHPDIERLARLICCPGPHGCMNEAGAIPVCSSYQIHDIARRAYTLVLDALSEPSEAMCRAAQEAIGFPEAAGAMAHRIQTTLDEVAGDGKANLRTIKWTGDIEYRAMLAAKRREVLND